MIYDYLIVGAGFFGSVLANKLTEYGNKCLVIDKKNHIGGHSYSEKINGIDIHKYGPHIFHTSNDDVWEYINKFTEFNNFTYRPLVNYKNKLYSFPINLLTFYQLWGIRTPENAIEKINKIKHDHIIKANNLEDYVLSKLGREIYEIFIKGYTEKQWGMSCKELPPFIFKRLPVRFNFNNNYFNDKYCGIPVNGYDRLFENLLKNIEIRLNVNFFDNKEYFESISKKIIYTGPVDDFFENKLGYLEYRSLDFEHKWFNVEDYQGNAAINFTEGNIPYTRIIEHKHFNYVDNKCTLITKEYPRTYKKGDEKYYPINNEKNNDLYKKYEYLASKEEKYIFGGRLAEYKYYNMDNVIENALKVFKKEIGT